MEHSPAGCGYRGTNSGMHDIVPRDPRDVALGLCPGVDGRATRGVPEWEFGHEGTDGSREHSRADCALAPAAYGRIKGIEQAAVSANKPFHPYPAGVSGNTENHAMHLDEGFDNPAYAR